MSENIAQIVIAHREELSKIQSISKKQHRERAKEIRAQAHTKDKEIIKSIPLYGTIQEPEGPKATEHILYADFRNSSPNSEDIRNLTKLSCAHKNMNADMEDVAYGTQIVSINFNGCQTVDDSVAETIATEIENGNFDDLTTLDLSNTKITDRGIQTILTAAIKQEIILSDISLEGHQDLSSETVSLLHRALWQTNTAGLNLSNTNINTDDLQKIIAPQERLAIASLKLNNCPNIDDSSIQVLKAKAANSTIDSLELNNTNVSNKALLDLLSESHIKQVDKQGFLENQVLIIDRNNRIEDLNPKGLSNITAVSFKNYQGTNSSILSTLQQLTGLMNVKSVDLSDTTINDADVESILKEPKSIEYSSLSFNHCKNITPAGIDKIISHLEGEHKLTVLNLGNLPITEEQKTKLKSISNKGLKINIDNTPERSSGTPASSKGTIKISKPSMATTPVSPQTVNSAKPTQPSSHTIPLKQPTPATQAPISIQSTHPTLHSP